MNTEIPQEHRPAPRAGTPGPTSLFTLNVLDQAHPETEELSPVERIFLGRDGLRAGWGLLLFVIFVACLNKAFLAIADAMVRLPAAQPPSLPPAYILSHDGALFLAIALATFALSRIERRPLRSYGMGRKPGALRQVLVGGIWGVVLLSTLIAALWLSHLLVFSGVQLSGIALLRFSIEWLFAFLFVALFEEYALRGYLQFTLARGIAGALRSTTESPYAGAIGFWIAAALLSFVFGLGHGNNPGESPIGLLSVGLIGLVFCLSLWRTGSLWWAVGFHTTWDWMQSFVFGVADSGTLVQFHVLGSHPQGSPLLSGGLTGPEGSLYVLPITGLIVTVIMLTLRGRGVDDFPAPPAPYTSGHG